MNDNGIMNDRLPIAKSIREDLANDIEKRNSLRESKLKVQKSLKAINGIAAASAISSGVAAGVSTATVLGIVVAVPLGGVAVLSSAVCAVVSILDRINNRRLKRHDRLRLLAYSTQNSLGEVIGRFAEDGKLNDIEWNFITAEFERYKQLVREVKEGKIVYVKTEIEKQKKLYDERLSQLSKLIELRFDRE